MKKFIVLAVAFVAVATVVGCTGSTAATGGKTPASASK